MFHQDSLFIQGVCVRYPEGEDRMGQVLDRSIITSIPDLAAREDLKIALSSWQSLAANHQQLFPRKGAHGDFGEPNERERLSLPAHTRLMANPLSPSASVWFWTPREPHEWHGLHSQTTFAGKKKEKKEENSAFEVDKTSAHRGRRLTQGGGKSSGLTAALCFKGATDGGSRCGMLRLNRLDPGDGPHLNAKNRFPTIAWPHSRLPGCMAFSKTPPKPDAIAVVCSRGTLSLAAIVFMPSGFATTTHGA